MAVIIDKKEVIYAAKVVEEIAKQVGPQEMDAVIQRFRKGEITKGDEYLLKKSSRKCGKGGGR